VFFSLHSVDVYNPKVVAAAKGSLFHTQVRYVDIPILLDQNPTVPVYGAMMNGENIYGAALPSGAFIIIGNEANGISHEVLNAITHRISIPSFGNAESLNVGVATGIIVSEWRRQGM
jgi:TrmH family RNA methyltransferase